MEYTVTGSTAAPLALGLTGLAELAQNVRVILDTRAASCPLARAFAGPAGYLDSPLPLATAARMAAIVAMVETYEPRVTVTKVEFVADPDSAVEGRLYPRVTFKPKE